MISSCHNPGAGPGQLLQVADFILAVFGQQQNRNGADLLKRKVCVNKFGPVGQLNQNSVKGFDAQIDETNS
jgi:hypothetical protein